MMYQATIGQDFLTDPIAEMQHIYELGQELPSATPERKIQILQEVARIIQWMPQYLVVQILQLLGFSTVDQLNSYINTLQTTGQSLFSSVTSFTSILKYAPYVLAGLAGLYVMKLVSD